MFISKSEKNFILATIEGLKRRVLNLEADLERLTAEFNYKRPPIAASDKAPWGTKKDGSPRKRPGRPRLTMKVGSK